MATMPKELDIKKVVGKQYTLKVEIKGLTQYRWRVWLALLLCRWATKIAWLELRLAGTEAKSIFLAVCDSENQPHQWMDHPDELQKALEVL